MLFARVENGVKKIAKKTPFWPEILEQFSIENFHFLAAEEPTFGGEWEYTFKTD